ncbi:hypothetical protein ACMA1I_05625 [Pontibacter sp. 13R65]|uniref:hypothetical protein n=1 Tax=Pontibacter sp. 13R65 TaxID=3127458 RepID=UPI00301BFAEE
MMHILQISETYGAAAAVGFGYLKNIFENLSEWAIGREKELIETTVSAGGGEIFSFSCMVADHIYCSSTISILSSWKDLVGEKHQLRLWNVWFKFV